MLKSLQWSRKLRKRMSRMPLESGFKRIFPSLVTKRAIQQWTHRPSWYIKAALFKAQLKISKRALSTKTTMLLVEMSHTKQRNQDHLLSKKSCLSFYNPSRLPKSSTPRVSRTLPRQCAARIQSCPTSRETTAPLVFPTRTSRPQLSLVSQILKYKRINMTTTWLWLNLLTQMRQASNQWSSVVTSSTSSSVWSMRTLFAA